MIALLRRILQSPWRILAAALLLGGLVGVAFCGSVLVVGLWLAAPTRSVVGLPPTDLQGAEVVRIPSHSGSLLHGWWLPGGEPGGGVVILMHGVRSDRRSMLQRARFLHGQGFAVLLFDFQSTGESPGAHITFGRLESLDAAAVVGFVRQRWPGERIGVIGVSLGGAASLLGPEPLPVDALVLEAVFAEIGAALANRLRVALGPVVGRVFTPLLVPTFELLLPPLIGVGPRQLRPIDHIGRVTAPLLLASGTDDRHTPIDEARSLFARAPEPKQFWPVPGAAHIDFERYDPAAYWRMVLPFLTAALRDGATPAHLP